MKLPEHNKDCHRTEDCPRPDDDSCHGCQFYKCVPENCPRCAVDGVIDLIKPYMRHKFGCRYNFGGKCDCGLDELLKELEV